jgi:hypothetical protein
MDSKLKYSTGPVMILPPAKEAIEIFSIMLAMDITPVILSRTDYGLRNPQLNGSIFLSCISVTDQEDNVNFFSMQGYYINLGLKCRSFCLTRVAMIKFDHFLEIKLFND